MLTNALPALPVKFFKLIVQLLLLTETKKETVNGSTPASTTTPGPTTPGTEVWWNVRLPENIVPDHYDVVLYIDLKKLVFFGDVSILVSITKPTENVLVHVNKMNITSAKLETASGGGEKTIFSLIARSISSFSKKTCIFTIEVFLMKSKAS